MSKQLINTVFALLTIACLVLVVVNHKTKSSKAKIDITEEAEEIIEPEIPKKYGFPIDDYDIVYDTVSRGETLGLIMQRHGITAREVDRISRMSSDTFNITRINLGRPYAVFFDKNHSDTISEGRQRPDYFVYQNGSVVYTVYDFSIDDQISVNKHRKPVDTVSNEASGIIRSSLWNAIVREGLSWGLAISLSQTFAWTVDFYALRKNDAFKVIYEEFYVNDQSIGIGDIQAGVFYHHGRELWAIPFEQDGVKGFFDTLGNNTRKTFLKAPLKYTRVSSRYSHARMHPIHNRPRAHLAVDFAAPTGTPVYAASDGVITKRAYGAGPGYWIKIRHNSVYSTVYMHFSRFGNYHVGDFVNQGDIIGYVGSTGWSTGPHLHYEIHENGQRIDPLKFEPPPADPVEPKHKERFNKEKRYWIDRINSIELESESTAD